MLTPVFELSQTDDYLKIKIKAPYAKISETEIFVEDNDFKFFSKPYFLRLSLPGNIVENGQESAEYDADKGEFSLSFPKQNPGQVFEGLDMITKLLAPKGTKTASQPLIEVIDTKSEEIEPHSCEKEVDAADNVTEEEEFDWCIEQTPYTENTNPLLTGAKYGFANQKTGVFERLQEELCDIVDCPDPDNMEPVQRQKARLAVENDKFDAEHYLGDFLEDDMIQPLLDYKPWFMCCKANRNSTSSDIEVELSEEEKEVMRKLPNKEYLLDEKEETAVYFSLVDLIFAYAYNNRLTEGENNVEAGWNISKLSSTLSWFEVHSSLQEVIIASYRRCLCYPLYRNWKLCQKVFEDVKQIFKLGRKCLLKCLLDVRRLLQDTDSRYILNDLYVTDYCVWIQTTRKSKLQSLSDTLQKIEISKDDIGFNLVELEELAVSAIDNSEIDSVTEGISELAVDNSRDNSCVTEGISKLKVDNSRDSDDDSSGSEEEDSSESSDESSNESSDESSNESSDESSEIIDSEETRDKVRKVFNTDHTVSDYSSGICDTTNDSSVKLTLKDRLTDEICNIGLKDDKSDNCSNIGKVLIQCLSEKDSKNENAGT